MSCYAALQDGEISLFGDATHLQEIMDSLSRQATQPDTLPASSEQVIVDVSGSSAHWVCPVRSRWLDMINTKAGILSTFENKKLFSRHTSKVKLI